ncbi:DUF222 domain-containing protein [Microbacterium sp. DT81.1]|uniref:HNH endonuclease signature motif containing protein n=1 Tax=Microbacterium sp. DT81.1 TaxID=3393413 RepID=UPI003CE7E4B5
MSSNLDRHSYDAATGVLVDSVVTGRAAIAALQAQEAEALAGAAKLASLRVAGEPSAVARAREMEMRSLVAEFATAVRVSERSMQRQVNEAETLVGGFPRTLAAWREGTIASGHVEVIVDAGFHIDDQDARRAYEVAVLARAERETPGRLRPVARIVADRLHPRSIDERHAGARLARAVVINDLPDGMAELIATLPAVLARGIHDRLSEQARAVKAARSRDDEPDAATGDPAEPLRASAMPPGEHDPEPVHDRSMDELRADILCDLLLTASPTIDDPATALGAIRATVQVTVPVLTLAGRSGAAATLAGSGPIDPETARVLAGGATGWDRVMTHPVTSAVLAVDRYRPSEDLRRTLRVRDEHCRFPGCRMPAHRCDLDHSHDAALGGATCEANLAHLCRRHHTLKHATRWTVRQLAGGVLEWTSPGSRHYTDAPEPVVRFMPSGDPRPF